ncbi:hypothetical protein BDL97_07G067500 [Sphagnum fallax]|nr:hypothetical protein BDL97_07G067500 [Sphagnum fallax]
MAGDHGNVHVVNSKQLWETKVEDAKSRGKIIVVDFTATWCGPCRLMAPVFSDLSKKYDILIFLKVDVDEVQNQMLLSDMCIRFSHVCFCQVC